ncbi:MAG: 4-alpha-glucanotransferase [Oscillospiraceae bacterium]|jgi:4-alpha-glucanotransferase|nr:4-alpha-glucanotransferase [Oscillospiraceae bacterium]
MRSSGILMHITSLPSPYGIGTFGADAEAFVDWLVAAGQKYWQILPLSPTGYGESPYQSFSTFAGNPLLIDLDDLAANGLLKKSLCDEADYGADPSFVDFEKVYRSKMRLLNEAFRGFAEDVGYLSFIREEAEWLDDYALFMSVKEQYNLNSWQTWDKEIRFRKSGAVNKAREELTERINFWKFIQYTFMRQWQKLKRYANKNGIKIIGDLPIYVALDSADVWSNADLFLLDVDCVPTKVAGVPPDFFSKTGQLWGNPLYNWERMKKEKYLWWISRVKKCAELYDVIRIDHFRAFDTYYAINYGEKNAVNGKWEKGPGMEFFNAVHEALGDIDIIAEDLGEVFESVTELLRKSGFPGMKILQFGFNPENRDSDHLPHHYHYNCAVYTGTHDNSTIKGWYQNEASATRFMFRNYLRPKLFEGIHFAAFRALYQSRAKLVVLPMQDVLGLYDNARMNRPSTLGGNWIWRMKKGKNPSRLAEKLGRLVKIYFRQERH